MKEKSMKKKIATLVLVLVVGTLAAVVLVSAQQPQPAQPPQGPQGQEQPRHPMPPMDPLGDAMFPPEMLMQHTRDLNLTVEQKTFMRGEIQKTTTRFNELQWQLQDAMEALHASMKENTVNEQQALAQLDKVLDAEREIKRLHFGLAIRIKNDLTPEQREKLHSMHQMPGPGGPGHGAGHGAGRGPQPPPPPPRPEGDEPLL